MVPLVVNKQEPRDSVNKCDGLSFEYPSSHKKAQRAIADGFKEKSKVGFSCCAGCIDGMLLWIEKPNDFECQRANCGSKKFFCGRKHKFGLNFQAACDANCKFLDVSMYHPAATSDFLSFTTFGLKKKLETPGFLAPGL